MFSFIDLLKNKRKKALEEGRPVEEAVFGSLKTPNPEWGQTVPAEPSTWEQTQTEGSSWSAPTTAENENWADTVPEVAPAGWDSNPILTSGWDQTK